MKISDLPIPFHPGSVYVRAEQSGIESRHIAGIVTSVFTDLDGNTHYNAEEFHTAYGTPALHSRSFRSSADLEFLSQQRETFEAVAGLIMDNSNEELGRLSRSLDKMLNVRNTISDAINGQESFDFVGNE